MDSIIVAKLVYLGVPPFTRHNMVALLDASDDTLLRPLVSLPVLNFLII